MAEGIYSSSKRIFYFDLLRCIAIILVILCHVCREFCAHCPVGTFRWYTAAVYIDVGVLGVPIFLMISGALLLNRTYTLSDFMKRRFSRILIPFIFWGLFLPFAKMMFLGYPWTIEEYYRLLFLNQYWFVWMLIGAYLLLPILNSFVKEYGLKGLEYTILLWIIFIILLKEQPIDLFSKIVETYDLGWTQLFAGYIGYIPLGYYLSVKEFNLDDKKLYILGLVFFIVFTLININYTIVASPEINNLMFYSYRRIVSTVQVVGLFLFIKYFNRYCENTDIRSWRNTVCDFFKENKYASKVIFSVSICSYGIYLTHYYWLYLLMFISENYTRIFSRNPVILPVVWLTICVLSWILILVVSKIPVLKYFSGAH